MNDTTTFQGQLANDHNLARYTSWRVGGNAKHVYWPISRADLIEFLKKLPTTEPLLWLGLGSNTLIRDGGFAGTVIITQGALQSIEFHTPQTFYVEAGVPCAKIAKQSATQHLTGGEFYSGIPGTMGGALYMNAGAFGGETWDTVEKVDVVNRQGVVIQRDPSEYRIAYRQAKGPAEEWFLAAYLRFEEDESRQARERIRNLLRERSAKQPIGVFSCGSVFRNPPNDYAGRLIEVAGLKGYRLGGAQVSPKHANFIINEDDAKAADIEALIQHVKQTVFEQTGISLETEVKIIGNHE